MSSVQRANNVIDGSAPCIILCEYEPNNSTAVGLDESSILFLETLVDINFEFLGVNVSVFKHPVTNRGPLFLL